MNRLAQERPRVKDFYGSKSDMETQAFMDGNLDINDDLYFDEDIIHTNGYTLVRYSDDMFFIKKPSYEYIVD